MPKIILVESNPAYRKLLTLNLEMYLGATISIHANSDSVREYLKDNQDIDLIVTEERVGEDPTVLKVYHINKSGKYNIPILLMGENMKLINDTYQVDKENWRKIINKSAKILKITSEKMAELEVPDFFPIDAAHFSMISELSVDVYDLVDHEYKVVMKKGDALVKDIIVTKQQLGENAKFYVQKLDRLKFTESFSTDLVEVLSKEMTTEQRASVTGVLFNQAEHLINSTGLNETAIKAAEATIESVGKIATETSGLSDLFNLLKEAPEGYLYRHTMIIAFVASHIVGKMEWGNDEQKDKVVFVAFFHDIAIPFERLCSIHSQDQLDESDLNDSEKARVKGHARKAAELIKKFPKIPLGAESIIIQHHGTLNGYGFHGEELSARLSPLTAVFMVAEEYAHMIIASNGDDFNARSAIENLKLKFSKKTFAKVVEALEASMLES